MPEPVTPRPDPSTNTTGSLSPPDGTVPPMPSEVTNGRTPRPAAAGGWRAAMMPLRKMMRRTPRGAA